MQVLKTTDIPAGFSRGCSVAVGTFDGVHLGHRRLLSALVADARAARRESIVLTFDPHPLSVIRPEAAPPLLMTPEDRAAQIAAVGADRLIMLQFTGELASELPGDFARRCLAERLKARRVFVGFNFTYGRGGGGTPDNLTALGRTWGFDVVVLPPVQVSGRTVSSSTIRQAVLAGDMEQAESMLSRPYYVTGPVVHGDGRGRLLGFPTANVAVPQELVRPLPGVYAVRLFHGERSFCGVANIGLRPTFGGKDFRLEVHIPGQSMDLYGEQVRVEFLRFLRPERRFRSEADLMTQIRADVAAALAVQHARTGGGLQQATPVLE